MSAVDENEHLSKNRFLLKSARWLRDRGRPTLGAFVHASPAWLSGAVAVYASFHQTTGLMTWLLGVNGALALAWAGCLTWDARQQLLAARANSGANSVRNERQ